MANIKQQKKRNKTNEKARIRNISYKSKLRTATKAVKVACDQKDAVKANAALLKAISIIDRAIGKGILHTKTAARQKSHLQTLVNEIVA
ncbi:MAG TPA: 30S ribosomal protein S20 [Candidatus Onthovivens sp.]|nr:30S ribosomal protein S20 [Candidatus Onthovivens sp.]